METTLEQPQQINQQNSEYFTYQDILDCRKNGGAGLKIKKYDPFIFWESMGEKWYQHFDNRQKFYINVPWLLDRLKLFQIDNLLDVGTGFGRVLPFLLESKVIQRAEGIDISPEILKFGDKYLTPPESKLTTFKNSLDAIKSVSIEEDIKKEINAQLELRVKSEEDKLAKAQALDFRGRISLNVGDARDLKYDSESFDCVLSSEVIQHLNPDDAYKACYEIYRIAKKVIVLCERWSFPGEHSESHIWSHDYRKMFPCQIDQITTVNPAIQGIVIIKS